MRLTRLAEVRETVEWLWAEVVTPVTGHLETAEHSVRDGTLATATRLRTRWSEVMIELRAEAGFARLKIHGWCEALGILSSPRSAWSPIPG